MRSVKHTLLTTVSACLFAASLSSASFAQDYISLNAGDWNALRSGQQHAFQYGAEYRFSEIEYGIRPMVGAFYTSKNAGYVYGGLDWDVALIPNQLYLVPNFAVGAYKEGDAKQLGGPLEFRSGIELDYQFPNAQQLGVALNHISNAGIYSHNSGEESVIATYSIPLSTVGSTINKLAK
jgi:lipid A 3-O-deacylase